MEYRFTFHVWNKLQNVTSMHEVTAALLKSYFHISIFYKSIPACLSLRASKSTFPPSSPMWFSPRSSSVRQLENFTILKDIYRNTYSIMRQLKHMSYFLKEHHLMSQDQQCRHMVKYLLSGANPILSLPFNKTINTNILRNGNSCKWFWL